MTPTTAEIRKFIQDALSPHELDDFCFDYYRAVYDDFGEGARKSQKVRALIEYADRRNLLATLLFNLYTERPEQVTAQLNYTPRATPHHHPSTAIRNPRQIFISHAHQDAAFAQQLADDLEAQGWEIWIAPDSIAAGERWAMAIERGLAESGIFVLVMTPDAVGSRWVQTETGVAIELEHEGEMQFLPLLLKPCQKPLLWRGYQHISFTRNRYDVGFAHLLDRLGSKVGAFRETPRPQQVEPMEIKRRTQQDKFDLLKEYRGHTYHINALDLNDDSLLVTVSGDRKAIVWSTDTGKIKAILKHDRWVGASKFLTRERLLTSDGNGNIRLWDWAQETVVMSLKAHEGACRALAVLENGEMMITGGADNKIKVWRLADFSLLRTIEVHRGEVRRLAVAHDNNTVASVGADGDIFIWYIKNQSTKLIVSESATIWRSVAFSRNNKNIAATNSNGVLFLWDLVNNIAKWRIQAHQGHAIGVDFDSQDKVVASSGEDKLIRLWNVQTGELIDTLVGHENTVTGVLFSGNNRLFSISRDKTIRLWHAMPVDED